MVGCNQYILSELKATTYEEKLFKELVRVKNNIDTSNYRDAQKSLDIILRNMAKLD